MHLTTAIIRYINLTLSKCMGIKQTTFRQLHVVLLLKHLCMPNRVLILIILYSLKTNNYNFHQSVYSISLTIVSTIIIDVNFSIQAAYSILVAVSSSLLYKNHIQYYIIYHTFNKQLNNYNYLS